MTDVSNFQYDGHFRPEFDAAAPKSYSI